jgi:hypothetical protein
MKPVPLWPRPLLWAFALTFAFWAIAQRYTGTFGGMTSLSGLVLAGLALIILACALTLVAVSVRRGLIARTLPGDAVVLVGALIFIEMAWRLVIHGLPDNGFKLLAVAAFLLQPVTAVLGVAAAAQALRSPRA